MVFPAALLPLLAGIGGGVQIHGGMKQRKDELEKQKQLEQMMQQLGVQGINPNAQGGQPPGGQTPPSGGIQDKGMFGNLLGGMTDMLLPGAANRRRGKLEQNMQGAQQALAQQAQQKQLEDSVHRQSKPFLMGLPPEHREQARNNLDQLIAGGRWQQAVEFMNKTGSELADPVAAMKRQGDRPTYADVMGLRRYSDNGELVTTDNVDPANKRWALDNMAKEADIDQTKALTDKARVETSHKSLMADIAEYDHATKIGDREKADRLKKQMGHNAMETIGEIENTIDEVIKNNKSGTGFTAWMANLPESDEPGAKTLRNQIETLRYTMFGENLIALKGRGATFGALSERELDVIMNAMGNLDRLSSPQEMKRVLNMMKRTANVLFDIDGGNPEPALKSLRNDIEYFDVQNADADLVFNPETGQLEPAR